VLCLFLLIMTGRLTSEPGRALAALLSTALLVQCWCAQRGYVRSRSRLVLLGLILALPALGSVWLVLNVVRFYSYAPESQASVYSAVVRSQEIVVNCAIALGLVGIIWSIAEVASVIGQRISHKLVGKRKMWWNRPLKGTWMLGYTIGYGIALLVASSFLRWTLLAVAVLGIVFAVIFRAIRNQDEI